MRGIQKKTAKLSSGLARPHFPETVSFAALWVHFKLTGIALKLVELMVMIAIHLKTFVKQ